MNSDSHPATPVRRNPNWSGAIALTAVLCSCVGLGFYVDSSLLTPEQLASIYATATARAIVARAEATSTIVTDDQQTAVAQVDSTGQVTMTETSAPQVSPSPVPASHTPSPLPTTNTPVPTDAPTSTSVPAPSATPEPSPTNVVLASTTLGRSLEEIRISLRKLGYQFEQVDTDEGYNIYEAWQGKVRVAVIGNENDTVRVSVLYLVGEGGERQQALETVHILFAAVAPDWDSQKWVDHEFNAGLEATNNYSNKMDIGNNRIATAHITHLMRGNTVALAIESSDSP